MYITINDEAERFVSLTYPGIYVGLYRISNYGTILNANTIKNVKPYLNNSGYCRIGLRDILGRSKRYYIARLVAYEFIHEPRDISQLQPNHKDTIRTHNYYKNLEWLTRSENQKFSFIHGNAIGRYYPHSHINGEDHYTNIFTTDIIHKCCRCLELKMTNKDIKLSIDFNGADSIQINSLLHHLRKRDSWKHVTKLYDY